MSSRLRTRLGLVALATAALVGAVAAAAIGANLTVYNNGFSSRANVQDLMKVQGKARCIGSLARRAQRLRLTARRGPATCAFRPPVESDRPRPNHMLRVDGVIRPQGPKNARNSAHLLLRVRAGGGTRYELHVLPKKGRFRLRRRPAGGPFPIVHNDDVIRRIGRLNQVRLVAVGSQIRATINGTNVAAVTDPSPGDVTGKRMHFGFAHDLRTTRRYQATVDRIALSVPTP